MKNNPKDLLKMDAESKKMLAETLKEAFIPKEKEVRILTYKYAVSFGEGDWGMMVGCSTLSQAHELTKVFKSYYKDLDYLEIVEDRDGKFYEIEIMEE